MSVTLELNSLDREKVKMISELLTLIPEDPKEKQWQRNPFAPKIPPKAKIPVPMYWIYTDEKTGKEYIRLPYRFGCAITGKVQNYHLPHTKYVRSGLPKFAVTLREIQKPIMEMAYNQMMTYSTTTLGVPPGIGKCLDPDTPVLLRTGDIILAKDVKVGHELCDEEGKATKVLSVTTGVDQMAKIVPTKGRPFGCNMPHILTLVSRPPTTSILPDGTYQIEFYERGCKNVFMTKSLEEANIAFEKVKLNIFDISVEEYITMSDDFKDNCFLFHVGVEFPEVQIKMDPYNYGFICGKSKEMKVEKDYKINSYENRIQVLAGVIDACSQILGNCIAVPYSEDIEYLALSLGFMAYQLEKPLNNALFIEGMFSSIPVKLVDLPKDIPYVNYQPFKVVETEIGVYNGFTLDGSRRFLLGDFTVTHNTIMGALLSYLGGFNTLVYCNRLTIAKQWRVTFNKCFPGFESWVWLVGEELQPISGIPPFIICMDERFNKIPQEFIDAVGMVIIDEAHMFCTPSQVECLLRCQPRFIVAESATLERDDGMHSMVQSIVGLHGVFMISQTPYDFICVNTQVTVEMVKNRFGNNYDQLCKNLAASQQRNLMMVDIVKSNPHRKFIILTKLTDHVELLEKYFTAAGIQSGTLYGNKNTYSDSRVLIGTMPKMGTGFDEENACEGFGGEKSNVLILAHSVKKWQQYEQFRGRVMRCLAPTIIWLNDPNSTTKRHMEELRPWILKTNGTIFPVVYRPGSIRLKQMPVEAPPMPALPIITTKMPETKLPEPK